MNQTQVGKFPYPPATKAIAINGITATKDPGARSKNAITIPNSFLTRSAAAQPKT